MKPQLTRIKSLLMVLCCAVFSLKGMAQAPTVSVMITNDAQVSPTAYEFDIMLVNSGSASWQLSGHQYGINYNPAIKNGGTMTISWVAGSSQLSNAAQLPGINLAAQQPSQMRLSAPSAPGAGNGSIIGPAPGVRVGRLRMDNSVPWAQAQPNLSFSWTASATSTRTSVGAYVGTTNTPLCSPGFNPTGCANQYLVTTTNAILNAASCTAPTLSAVVTNATCASGNDGAIDLTITGGSPSPFSIAWSNNATSEDLSALTAGTYTVTVTTQSGGCSASASYTVNDGAPSVTYFADVDGDGFGNANSSLASCTGAPAGYVAVSGDCNDGDNSVNPGVASDGCNGVDNDCDGSTDEDATFSNYYADGDGDGYGAGSATSSCSPIAGSVTLDGDCNDSDNAVNPGVASDGCNGVDNDCDGSTDEDATFSNYYVDGDGDGYGAGSATSSCSPIAGSVTLDGDCNDSDNSVNPGVASDGCNGVDNDCDGSTDEDATFSNYYADGDGDGYGAGAATSSCSPIAGSVTLNGDCDDANPSINPAAAEVCNALDDDCDGTPDDGLTFVTYYADADGDSYGDLAVTSATCNGAPAGYVSNSADCNDNNNAINPAATEVCNNVDDDCDGTADDGLTFLNYYVDGDGDGYGAGAATSSCSPIAGSVTLDGDCNDSDNSVNPGVASDGCNGVDNDCDGSTDEDATFSNYYADGDGDGYGAGAATSSCSPIAGSVTLDGDCNDSDNSVNPGVASDGCNGVDNDCDGSTDEDATFSNYYVDGDGDGYGAGAATSSCSPIAGSVTLDGDCNDSDNSVNPGVASDGCNGVDNDCDGSTDEDATFSNYYADGDGDGYGAGAATSSCSSIAGSVTLDGDCDDNSNTTFPGAPEQCNGIDDDCDGSTDESVTISTWYADADGDTYGNPAVSQSACAQPSGYVLSNTDCDDTNSAINPGATEICNSLDDDCDGSTDEGVTSTFYADADADGYGVSTSTVQACVAPAGFATLDGDCNDGDNSVNPGVASDGCNGVDNDCDGSTDEDATFSNYYVDGDGDGYGAGTATSSCSPIAGSVTLDGDCNDSDNSVNPGVASDGCNGVDNDCDGSTDEDGVLTNYYVDADGDGYGAGAATSSCSPIAGSVTLDGDCNDSDNSVNPGVASDGCNGVDNDCDGSTDEDATFSNYYADGDGDGYGAGAATSSCSPIAGSVTLDGDCNDSDNSVNPGVASDGCNGVDNDCDGSTDEDATFSNYYVDGDGDGYGAGAATSSCSPIAGSVTLDGDCDDSNNAINPAAAESCNNIDDDCDGSTDDGLTTFTYYADVDGDTYGNAASSISVCATTAPSGYVTNSTDCNDGDNAVNPAATEVCGNSIDDNCDGNTDEGCGCSNPATANAGANQSVCANQTVTLNGSIGGGATNGTWTTSGDGTFSPSATVLNAVYTPGAADIAAGTVTLTLTTDAPPAPCTPATSSLVITIDPLPSAPGAISGPAAICNPYNTTITYSVAPVAGATSYNWTVPAGTNIISGQGTTSIIVSWPFSAIHAGVIGQICVTANNTNNCGSGTPSCLNITMQLTTPVAPSSISGPVKACPGDIIVYSVSPVVRATGYNWTVPAGATIVSGAGTNVVTVEYSASFTGGTISVAGTNGCGVGAVRSRNINLNVLSATASISGQLNGLCGATGVIYNANPVVGAVSYLWTVPAGASITGGQGTASITVDYSSSFTTGAVTVVAQNGCGNGAVRSATVIGAPGQPSPITGPAVLCANQNYNFSVNTVAGASTYVWTIPSGFQIISGQGTKDIVVKAGAATATGLSISVRASNGCGTGAVRSRSGLSTTVCPRIGEESAMNVAAYPNPVSDLLNITFDMSSNRDVLVTMTDAAGRVVLNENRNADEGSNKLEISVKGLASGFYTVQLLTGDAVEKIRIVVE